MHPVTTRQTLEILALAIVCLASLRGFWRGTGFSASKKLGLTLAVAVFLILSAIILR
jgi:hypothetical protein